MSRPRPTRHFLFVLLAAVLFAAAWPGQPLSASRQSKADGISRILVVHSFGQGNFRTDGLSRGIEEGIRRGGLPMRTISEFLNFSSLGDTPEFQEFLEGKRRSIKALIAAQGVDAVMLTDSKAMDFWVDGIGQAGADLPVVYLGIGESAPEKFQKLSKAVSVLEVPGYAATVEAAARLCPKADKLLVLGEKSILFEANRRLLRRDLERQTRFSVEYFQGTDVSSMEERVRTLGPDWLVLAVGRPEIGGRQDYRPEVASRLAEACPVPIFTVWTSWMGHGPVGGRVIRPEEQGTQGLRLVRELLAAGADGVAPGSVSSSGVYLFDHLALSRFKFSQAALPPGSEIINKPLPFYQANRELVWTWGLVTVALSVVALLLASNAVFKRKARSKAIAQANFITTLLDAMPTPVFYKDAQGIYQGCNKAFEDFLGLTRNDLVGRSVHDLYPASEADVFKAKDDELLASQGAQVYEFEKTTPHGLKKIRFHKAVYRDGDGRTAGIVGVISDVTSLRQAEAEAERARNYLQAIIDSSPSIIFCADDTGRVTHTNAKARDLCRDCSPEGLTRSLPALNSLWDEVRRSIEEFRPLNLPRVVEREAGRLTAWDAMIYPMHAFGLREAVVRIDDVTQAHRMQEVLAQSEKMMSVGGLAAGMAHEINNPLGGIMQGAQVIANRLRPDLAPNRRAAEQAGCDMEAIHAYLRMREIPDLLTGVRESAVRAASIVANMLEFSRRSNSAWLPVDLGELLDKAVDLCLQDYNLTANFDFRRIDIRRDYDPATPKAPCAPQQVQQVLFNLLRNAAQAMSEASTPHPAITLRTRLESEHAVIEVEDNGPGMSEAVRRKVFEPFFTTKTPGLGTGLGLSVSYFIIHENHGGDIEVRSEPGKGATFVVKLPLKAGRTPLMGPAAQVAS